jgi:hypothetical protein
VLTCSNAFVPCSRGGVTKRALAALGNTHERRVRRDGASRMPDRARSRQEVQFPRNALTPRVRSKSLSRLPVSIPGCSPSSLVAFMEVHRCSRCLGPPQADARLPARTRRSAVRHRQGRSHRRSDHEIELGDSRMKEKGRQVTTRRALIVDQGAASTLLLTLGVVVTAGPFGFSGWWLRSATDLTRHPIYGSV